MNTTNRDIHHMATIGTPAETEHNDDFEASRLSDVRRWLADGSSAAVLSEPHPDWRFARLGVSVAQWAEWHMRYSGRRAQLQVWAVVRRILNAAKQTH